MAAKIGLLAEISGVRRTRSRRKALLSRSYSPEKMASGISRRSAVDVVLGDPDAAALAQALVGDRGAGRPGDHDVLAQPVLVLHDPLLQAFPEGHEQRDRHRAPGDPEEGQERPHLLVADVLQHLPEEGEGGHVPHYSIFLGGRSTTRSFSWSPSTTSMFMPSERPTLISFLPGARARRPGHLDGGLPVGEGHQALGHEEHVLLLADHDVGVGGVARAQHHALAGQQLDLDVEERRPLRGLGLGGDLVDPARPPSASGSAPTLMRAGMPFAQLAHVDLVHRSLEDERGHVGQVVSAVPAW